MTVSFTAYNPAAGFEKMETKPVAEYAYDSKGRLRAEWDPRITPSPLKTTYGYDAEGHVTAVDPPGQEPWLLHYGTTATDTSTGRLLSLTRLPAGTSAQVKEQDEQAAPVNTAAPALSSTKPAVGTRIAVSGNGTWSNAPLAYSYQWDDCNSAGKECAAIPGAVNEAYYPAKSDEGHTLVAQVIAVNATGAVSVVSAATSVVASGTSYSPLPEPPALGTSSVTTIDYNVPLWGEGAPDTTAKNEAEEKAEREKWGQTDDPTEPVPGETLATAIFPPDEPMGWPAKDYKRATITYLDELGRTVNRASPSGGIATSEYNETNEITRSLSADNRAAALKEGAKSKEVSELLDTKSRYNGETKEEKEKEETEGAVEPGTRLLEVRGPQHTVKLSTGSEVKARAHVHYYYDEGAPGGERYDLVTKTTDGAEYEGKEADVRTSTTAYSGQENLGWKLRKPTSVTTDPSGLKLTSTTFYDPKTGSVIESRSPAGGTGSLPAGTYAYSSQIASGGAPASMKAPEGVTVDRSGNIWVADTGYNRVQEYSVSGQFIRQFGSTGTGNGQFKEPHGIAVDSKEHVWVTDTGNNRVQEFSSTGTYLGQFGKEGVENGQFKAPRGIAIDGKGNLWVVDGGNSRVQEFSSTGSYSAKFGALGTENGQFKAPRGIAIDSKEDVWVVDSGNSRIEEFSSAGAYMSRFGTTGTGNGQFNEPYGIAVDGKGNLWVVDTGNNRVQEFSSTGAYLSQFGSPGPGAGHFLHPTSVAIDSGGHLWVTDDWELFEPKAGRLQEFTESHEYTGMAWSSSTLKEPEGVTVVGDKVWMTNTGTNKVEEFSTNGTYAAGFGTAGTGNGQFNKPGGVAVDPKGNVWVVDSGNNRVQEFSPAGEYLRQFGSTGTGNGQFKEPRGIAIDSKEDVWILDTGNKRVQEFSITGEYIRQFKASGLFSEGGMLSIAVDSTGHEWLGSGAIVREFSSTGEEVSHFFAESSNNGLAVDPKGNVWVTSSGGNPVQEFTSTGALIRQFGVEGTGNGQLKKPAGLALDSAGNVWVADTANNRIQEFAETPAGHHASQTIYYTVGGNYAYPACGKHPEWAGLSCRAQPALQPGKGPLLPVVTDSAYNTWDEPETITEEYGSTTRTKKLTYDAAGRALTSEETATGSSDTAVPKVTDEYSSETGVMVKQSTTVGETTKSIQSVYDTIGQLTMYTDADGNATAYTYSGPANDGMVEEVKYGGSKGSQMYSYDPTTKALTKLLDVGSEGGAGAGSFTAGYDVEGKMTSETYPNGMTAKYTFNPGSEAAGIEYEKMTHCAGTCPEVWFKETVMSSIHGEALVRTSTLAKEEYTYDNAGRLTKVNETPTGKGCKTRIYAYNEDTDRTSETTRESATETCATTGGAEEKHAYDEADRLIDTGVEYEAFGSQTKTAAVDAGEHEITASFYADNQVAVQKQNGETTDYTYDPAGRTEKTVSEGTTKATVVNHYPGPGEAISWACEEAAKECEEGKGTKWTRNIPGIDGSLAATQHDSEAAVLQLHDLGGDVVATAAVSETETKLLTSYNPTEFGVPVNGTPPTKYSWLGASGFATEALSGAANPGGGSYVPQLGKPLQTAPTVPPGSPTMMYVSPYANALTSGMYESAAAYAAGALGREATRQREAKEQWEREHPPTPPGAVPSPGEGGAGGGEAETSDPEGLASYKRTLGRAKQLRSDATNTTLIAYACQVVPGLDDLCAAGGGLLAASLEASAHNLEVCAAYKYAGGTKWEWGVCFINETRAYAPGNIFSIPIWAEAEPCSYETTVAGKNVHYCSERKASVWGPWY